MKFSNTSNLSKCVTSIIISILIVVGFVVLWGWFVEYERIVILIDGFPSMKANTAICFILLGMGLLVRLRRNKSWATIIALTTVLISGLTIFEYATKSNFGIDQLVVKDPWSGIYPGRMSIGTAIAFFLSGVLIYVMDSWPDERPYLFDIFLILTLSGPLFAVFAYIYSPSDLFGTRVFSTMSLHTAIGFILFLVGIAINAGGSCSAGLLVRPTLAGKRFRFLLPQVLLLPLVLGWVLERVIIGGRITPSLGIPIFSVIVALIIIISLSWSAQRDDEWSTKLEIERQARSDIETKMNMVLDLAGDAVLLVAQNGTILYLNSGAERILGYSAVELRSKNISMLIPARLHARHENHMKTFIESVETSRIHNNPLHMVALHKNGNELPVMITITKRVVGKELLVAAIIKDASFVKRQIDTLNEKAHFDALTGIRNRRSFEERINAMKLSKQRKYDGLAILMMDIDYFKKINDTWGHDIGDEVLQGFAIRVNSCLRHTDELYRYGGEEFVVIANTLELGEANDLAERICNRVRATPIISEEVEITITCSVGIGVPLKGEKDIFPALERADKALYRAKESGRNRVVYDSLS